MHEFVKLQILAGSFHTERNVVAKSSFESACCMLATLCFVGVPLTPMTLEFGERRRQRRLPGRERDF